MNRVIYRYSLVSNEIPLLKPLAHSPEGLESAVFKEEDEVVIYRDG